MTRSFWANRNIRRSTLAKFFKFILMSKTQALVRGVRRRDTLSAASTTNASRQKTRKSWTSLFYRAGQALDDYDGCANQTGGLSYGVAANPWRRALWP